MARKNTRVGISEALPTLRYWAIIMNQAAKLGLGVPVSAEPLLGSSASKFMNNAGYDDEAIEEITLKELREYAVIRYGGDSPVSKAYLSLGHLKRRMSIKRRQHRLYRAKAKRLPHQ